MFLVPQNRIQGRCDLKGSSWTSDSPVSELGSDLCMSTSTASVEYIGERPREEACDVYWRGWVKGLHIL